MTIFFFYIIAMLVLFTLCAGIADLIGHFNPDWMAEADESLEDAQATRGTGS